MVTKYKSAAQAAAHLYNWAGPQHDWLVVDMTRGIMVYCHSERSAREVTFNYKRIGQDAHLIQRQGRKFVEKEITL
jgi:hypothetical protein